jgi:hypothetical protein
MVLELTDIDEARGIAAIAMRCGTVSADMAQLGRSAVSRRIGNQ